MGANSSTRRVSFESDENDNISVVKGIRLSENVLNRMREPAAPPKKQQRAPTRPTPLEPTLTPSPLLRPLPPPFDPITSLPPPPPRVEPVAPPAPPPPAPLATETVATPPPPPPPPPPPLVEPVAPPAPAPAPLATETVATPPPPPPPQPPAEQVAAPTIADMVLPTSSLPTLLPAPLAPAPCTASAAVEELAVLASPPLVIEPSPPPPPPINQPIASSAPVMEAIAPPQVIESIESIAPAFVSEPITCPSPVEMEPIAAPPPPQSEPLYFPPILEPELTLPPPPPPSGDTLSLQPAEPLASPPMPEFTSPCEPVAPPPQLPVEPVPAAPVPEPVAVPESIPVPPPPPPPAVDEEALRKTISVELHKGFEEERAKAEQELQAWLDFEKTRAAEQANADAQSQVHSEVSRILSVERAMVQENLQQALVRERIATEDEMLRAQIYEIGLKAKQLEAREADLKKQDVFYRDQVARLEERSAQFYKVTTENYHKSADQVNAKFKRYEMYPVCTDLQGQILACYKENVGKTLHCSNIAALYLQCVNNSKQNKSRTGG